MKGYDEQLCDAVHPKSPKFRQATPKGNLDRSEYSIIELIWQNQGQAFFPLPKERLVLRASMMKAHLTRNSPAKKELASMMMRRNRGMDSRELSGVYLFLLFPYKVIRGLFFLISVFVQDLS